MKQSKSDPVIDEVREVRHRISARFVLDIINPIALTLNDYATRESLFPYLGK